MLLKLDTHDKQDNDTVNTLKNCYNDVYANIMHNDHILCYLVFSKIVGQTFITHLVPQFLLNYM